MSNEPDPWAGDQPVAPAPIEFVFNEPESPEQSRAAPPFDESTGDVPPVAIDHTARRRWIGAGIGFVVIVAGLVVATTFRQPSEDPTSTPDSTVAPATTLVEELPAATTPSATAGEQVTTSGSTLPEAPLAWVDGKMEIPERLTGFADPTQLVLVTGRGRVVEIDLRDGSTSTLELSMRSFDVRLHLRREVALISGNGSGRRPIIVERGEQPIDVDVSGGSGGYFISDDDSNVEEFIANTFDTSTGESTTRSISTDGVVSDVDDRYLFRGAYAVSTGERLAYSGGDIFLTSPPGQQPETSRRLSTGLLIGRSPSAVLVHECDDQRNCTNQLIDVVSEERAPVNDFIDHGFPRNLQLASMSPDGTAMLVSSARNGTFFLELDTGNGVQLPFRISTNGRPSFAWTLDGSGIFVLHGGDLQFVDRFTGETTELPIELETADNIVDIGIRRVPGT